MSSKSSSTIALDKVEYQRIRRPSEVEATRLERSFRICCLVVLSVETVLTLLIFGAIMQVLNTPILHDTRSVVYMLLGLMYSVFNVATLAYGLFATAGHQFVLLVNLIFFQLIPYGFTLIAFMFYASSSDDLRAKMQMDPETVWPMIVALPIVVYRAFAVYSIYRYGSILREKKEIHWEHRPSVQSQHAV